MLLIVGLAAAAGGAVCHSQLPFVSVSSSSSRSRSHASIAAVSLSQQQVSE